MARNVEDAPETNERQTPPTVVVLGGVDPGGGAGLLRDVATARALGVYAYAIGTAWTEQTDAVHRVEARDPAAIRDSLARAIADLRPAAVKIGMAVGPETASALVVALAGYKGPVVIDPVLATSRGGRLWEGSPRDLLPLLRRATVATPNAIEAATLAERPVATKEDAEKAGMSLVSDAGLEAVLVKGGHVIGTGPVTDILVSLDGPVRIEHARLPGPIPRGTGCAIATAVAVGLARGLPLEASVRAAALWLAGTIADAQAVRDEIHLPG